MEKKCNVPNVLTMPEDHVSGSTASLTGLATFANIYQKDTSFNVASSFECAAYIFLLK